MLELRTLPAPAGLASLGQVVELRELDYGTFNDAVIAAHKGSRNPNMEVLAASLHVDGQPVGLDRLRALPGRFASALSKALRLVNDLHKQEGDTDDDEEQASAPAPAPEGGNA